MSFTGHTKTVGPHYGTCFISWRLEFGTGFYIFGNIVDPCYTAQIRAFPIEITHYTRREENQLDVTECFIALIICLTCFGHSCPSSGARDYTCVTAAYGV